MARVRFHLSFTQMSGLGIHPTMLKEMVKTAERQDFDGITHGDEALLPPPAPGAHFLEGSHGDQFNQGHMACLPLLGHFAAVTNRIRLNSNILILPLYHPVHVANQAATIDNLSGGRMTLRVGTGLFPWEFKYFGLPWEHRGKMLTEGIELIRKLWTQETVTHDGEYYKLGPCKLASQRPIQKPSLPIWIGTAGNKEYLLKRVARYADGWDMVYHWPSQEGEGMDHRHRGTSVDSVLDNFRTAVRFIREEAMKLGRDPDEIRHSPGSVVFSVGRNNEATKKMADEYIMKTRGEEFGSPPSGDPTHVTNYLKRFVEAGATDFTICFVPYVLNDTMQMMELFSEEVIPNFRK